MGAWEAIAAVGAYFSLLEHESVLVSAFADVTPGGGALLSFIGDWWSDKFRRLFDMGDAATNRVHQHLHEIAETYRNPYSHGGLRRRFALVPLGGHRRDPRGAERYPVLAAFRTLPCPSGAVRDDLRGTRFDRQVAAQRRSRRALNR